MQDVVAALACVSTLQCVVEELTPLLLAIDDAARFWKVRVQSPWLELSETLPTLPLYWTNHQSPTEKVRGLG